MRKRSEYKEDFFFAFLSFLAWFVTAPAMLVTGIWLDARWFGTAIIVVLIGVLFAVISTRLDKLYAERREPK